MNLLENKFANQQPDPMQISPFVGGVIANVFPDAAELVILPERLMFPLTSSF